MTLLLENRNLGIIVVPRTPNLFEHFSQYDAMRNFKMPDFNKFQPPPTDSELLGAFEIFRDVPPQCQTVYFLRLLDLPHDVISDQAGTTYQEMKKQFENAKNILLDKIDAIVEIEMKHWENPDSPASPEDNPAVLMVRHTLELVKPRPMSDETRNGMFDHFRKRLIVLTRFFLDIGDFLPPSLESLRISVRKALNLRDRYREQ